VRRLTRRLERPQKGVERIGSGDFAARVEVEGRDEVAGLAASFNLAAEEIEKLHGAHRLLLANASHELRPRFRASGLASKCWRTGAIRLEGRHCGRTLPSWIR
jgi:signal transduction histidine kinase